MYAFRHNLQAITTLWLAALLLAGCAETTVAPTIRAAEGLPPPDRLLVYDLAVSPSELEVIGGLDSQAAGGTGAEAQSEEDIRTGKAFAKVAYRQSCRRTPEGRHRCIPRQRVGSAWTEHSVDQRQISAHEPKGWTPPWSVSVSAAVRCALGFRSSKEPGTICDLCRKWISLHRAI